MAPKYANGQKVKIIEVKNQHLHVKYPKIQKYVNETGVILDSDVIHIKGLQRTHLEGLNEVHYVYKVCLDKDGTVLGGIEEDALVALDE